MTRSIDPDEKVRSLHRAFCLLLARVRSADDESLAVEQAYEWVDEIAIEIMRTPSRSWPAAQCKIDVMRCWFAIDAAGLGFGDDVAATALRCFIDDFEAMVVAHLARTS